MITLSEIEKLDKELKTDGKLKIGVDNLSPL
jgi:hypothetical protein